MISERFGPMISDVSASTEEARTKSDTGRKGIASRPLRKKMYFKNPRMATHIERARIPNDSILGTSHMRGIATWSCCNRHSVYLSENIGLIRAFPYQLRSNSRQVVHDRYA